ncbi:MAG: hypothetical protein ABUT20_64410 [Bacteroidota bacterium]
MYPLIKPPLFANKDFFEFTKNEAKEYLRWFLSIKDERISILESDVKKIYSEWQANYTKESLKVLYEWFAKQIEYRGATDDEKKEVENQITKTPLFVGIIPLPQNMFTTETVSICFDIGIYFGETLIKNIPSLKWDQKIDSPKYIYYAQPLLAKFQSKVPVNPRASMEGIARRILDKDVQEITFEMLYDTWFTKFLK